MAVHGMVDQVAGMYEGFEFLDFLNVNVVRASEHRGPLLFNLSVEDCLN
jgi:hypothetical protein